MDLEFLKRCVMLRRSLPLRSNETLEVVASECEVFMVVARVLGEGTTWFGLWWMLGASPSRSGCGNLGGGSGGFPATLPSSELSSL